MKTILLYQNLQGDYGTFSLGVKHNQTKETSSGHGNNLLQIDAEVLKHRYQIGLETLVVYAMNNEYFMHIMCIQLTRKYSAWGKKPQGLNLKKLAGIQLNGGTCVLIGQYTKNLTNIFYQIKFKFLVQFNKNGSAWLSSVRVVRCMVQS